MSKPYITRKQHIDATLAGIEGYRAAGHDFTGDELRDILSEATTAQTTGTSFSHTDPAACPLTRAFAGYISVHNWKFIYARDDAMYSAIAANGITTNSGFALCVDVVEIRDAD